ncbi:MAG: ParA family protein [Desulfococcaceae bacterium]|jgi:chromosome partitioning protein|nr:ParA family protein [Desulfococcaceae bacterium]
MGKIITVASHKGGVGKTTTTLNTGFSLSRFGQKVLLIDSDPQGGMAMASNLKRKTEKGLIHLLKNEVKPEQVVIPTKDRRMGILGPGITEPEDVFFFEMEARKGNLGKIITVISEKFDYTFVDAPAGLGGIVTSLLSVSSSVLVPVNCSSISVRTLPVFLKLIRKIRAKFNPGLMLEGILMTLTDESDSCTEIFEEMESNFPAGVILDTCIPYDESFERAGLKSIPAGMLKGAEEAAQVYMNLAMELKTREMKGKTKEGDEDEGLF